jgi:hypothetical protein
MVWRKQARCTLSVKNKVQRPIERYNFLHRNLWRYNEGGGKSGFGSIMSNKISVMNVSKSRPYCCTVPEMHSIQGFEEMHLKSCEMLKFRCYFLHT